MCYCVLDFGATRGATVLVGYARTSTKEQEAGFEAQKAELLKHGCEKIFEEQVSSFAARLELDRAIEFVRDGDTLMVTKLDRLARSLTHLQAIMAELERKKVALWILAMGLQTNTPTGKLLWRIVGSIAEFEREMMLERQIDGIAKAKREGKYLGQRPKAMIQAEQIVSLRQSGLGVIAIADQLGVHRTSVYRVLRRNDPRGDMAKCKAWLDREAKKGSRIVSVKADAVVRPARS